MRWIFSIYATIEELRFLRSPCQEVINGTSLKVSESARRRLEGWCEMAVSLGISSIGTLRVVGYSPEGKNVSTA
jgi:hypothetical protein